MEGDAVGSVFPPLTVAYYGVGKVSTLLSEGVRVIKHCQKAFSLGKLVMEFVRFDRQESFNLLK